MLADRRDLVITVYVCGKSVCLKIFYTRRVRETLLATIDIYIEKLLEGLCAEKVPLMRVYSRAEGGLFRHTDH